MSAPEPHLLPDIGPEVATGLTRMPKSLPAKLLYDARGSALFGEITRLPQYYPTRTEAAILSAHAPEIARAAGSVRSIVELGAGTAVKSRTLIAAFLREYGRVSFSPVDISKAALRDAYQAVAREFPQVPQSPVVADYLRDLSFVTRVPPPRLVLYLGSSIGNFEISEAASLLSRLRAALCPGDALLLGTDMRKDPAILLEAYDDRSGVTAAFNANVLARINRELGGTFDLTKFRHVVHWDDERSRVEMYLESTERQTIGIDRLGLTVRFEPGERIHTENSGKYTPEMVELLLRGAGFFPENRWSDDREWFCDYLARVR